MEKRFVALRLLLVFGICTVTSCRSVLAADQHDELELKRLEPTWKSENDKMKNEASTHAPTSGNRSGKQVLSRRRRLYLPDIQFQKASQLQHFPELKLLQKEVNEELKKCKCNNESDADLEGFAHALEKTINNPDADTLDKFLCYITLNVSVQLEIFGRKLIRKACEYLKFIGEILHHSRGFIFVICLVYLISFLLFQCCFCYKRYKYKPTILKAPGVNSIPRSGKKRSIPATITIIDIAKTKRGTGYSRMYDQSPKKMKLAYEAQV